MHKTRGGVIQSNRKFKKGCFSIAVQIKWKEKKKGKRGKKGGKGKGFTKNYTLIMPPITHIKMLLICNTIAFQTFHEL